MNLSDHLEADQAEIYSRRHFASPGGNSALRASSRRNPRNLPCPTCKADNRLTPADVSRGYQCNSCANAEEGCGF